MNFSFDFDPDESKIIVDYAQEILDLFDFLDPNNPWSDIRFQKILSVLDKTSRPNQIAIPLKVSCRLVKLLSMKTEDRLEQKRIFKLYKKAAKLLETIHLSSGYKPVAYVIWLAGYTDGVCRLLPHFDYQFEKNGTVCSITCVPISDDELVNITEILSKVHEIMKKVN